jgi:hemerythrin-like domain-containing protein
VRRAWEHGLTVPWQPSERPGQTDGVTTVEEPPWDLYREIHKALRFALFGVTVMVGAADPSDQASIDQLAQEWVRVTTVLNGHHEHEDKFCDPLIQRHAPALRDELEDAHRVSRETTARLTRLISELSHFSASAGSSLARIYSQLSDFTAAYLGHLRFEEEEVMPVLNAALSNDELAEITMAIRMSVPPPEMCVFIRYMAPSMNLLERAEMLIGMRAAPSEVFELFRSATEGSLTPAEYAAVARSVPGLC